MKYDISPSMKLPELALFTCTREVGRGSLVQLHAVQPFAPASQVMHLKSSRHSTATSVILNDLAVSPVALCPEISGLQRMPRVVI